jgi:hypothetical protein
MRQRATCRADQGLKSIFVSVCLIAVLLVVFSGVARASWNHIEGRSEILPASSSPVSTVIKQAVGQTVSLLMLVVAIIIAVPLAIAGFALSISYLLSRAGRHVGKQRRILRARVPADALPH